MNIFNVKIFVSLLLIFPLVACGGGGSSTPVPSAAQKIDLTVGLQGSGTIDALDMQITLPDGFTWESDAEGNPTDLLFVQLLVGGEMDVHYIPETDQANGMLSITIFANEGFTATDLFMISRIYPPNSNLPTEEDFLVTLEASATDQYNTIILEGITGTVDVAISAAP